MFMYVCMYVCMGFRETNGENHQFPVDKIDPVLYKVDGQIDRPQ